MIGLEVILMANEDKKDFNAMLMDTAQYAVQRGKAQDGDWPHQAEQDSHGGLLRHAGRDPERSEEGTALKPLQVRRALQSKLLQRGTGEGPQLLRAVHTGYGGRSAGGLQGTLLRLPPSRRGL